MSTVELFRMYEGTSYGFCEICRKTDVPTTLDKPDGTFEVLCPTCCADVYEDAETILDVCEVRGCSRGAVTICSKCGDAICNFHENGDGLCDICTPPAPQYNRGWTGAFDH